MGRKLKAHTSRLVSSEPIRARFPLRAIAWNCRSHRDKKLPKTLTSVSILRPGHFNSISKLPRHRCSILISASKKACRWQCFELPTHLLLHLHILHHIWALPWAVRISGWTPSRGNPQATPLGSPHLAKHHTDHSLQAKCPDNPHLCLVPKSIIFSLAHDP